MTKKKFESNDKYSAEEQTLNAAESVYEEAERLAQEMNTAALLFGEKARLLLARSQLGHEDAEELRKLRNI